MVRSERTQKSRDGPGRSLNRDSASWTRHVSRRVAAVGARASGICPSSLPMADEGTERMK